MVLRQALVVERRLSAAPPRERPTAVVRREVNQTIVKVE